jgi:hypothetical protein
MPAFRYVKNITSVMQQMARNNVWSVADSGAPVNGTSGTGVGMLGPGSVYTDLATGLSYVNIGTISSPIWAATDGPIQGNGGLGVIGNAKMTYDFAVDGGAVGLITPANSPTLPINAIILGGTIDITTTLTSGGSATIAVGLGSGAQVAALKAALAVASWTAGQLAIIPVFTAATYLKVAAATPLTLTVATAALTAGKFDVNLLYVQGN